MHHLLYASSLMAVERECQYIGNDDRYDTIVYTYECVYRIDVISTDALHQRGRYSSARTITLNSRYMYDTVYAHANECSRPRGQRRIMPLRVISSQYVPLDTDTVRSEPLQVKVQCNLHFNFSVHCIHMPSMPTFPPTHTTVSYSTPQPSQNPHTHTNRYRQCPPSGIRRDEIRWGS